MGGRQAGGRQGELAGGFSRCALHLLSSGCLPGGAAAERGAALSVRGRQVRRRPVPLSGRGDPRKRFPVVMALRPRFSGGFVGVSRVSYLCLFGETGGGRNRKQ